MEKKNDHVPGGSTLGYCADNLIKFVPVSKLSEKKDIPEGFTITATLIKSRTKGVPMEPIGIFYQPKEE